jgi:hypothetical protein
MNFCDLQWSWGELRVTWRNKLLKISGTKIRLLVFVRRTTMMQANDRFDHSGKYLSLWKISVEQ